VTSVKPWVTFAGCVLVIAVLYWAQAVLVPIALAAAAGQGALDPRNVFHHGLSALAP
jgi:hypothetical protein